jgi:hypothetical protein
MVRNRVATPRNRPMIHSDVADDHRQAVGRLDHRGVACVSGTETATTAAVAVSNNSRRKCCVATWRAPPAPISRGDRGISSAPPGPGGAVGAWLLPAVGHRWRTRPGQPGAPTVPGRTGRPTVRCLAHQGPALAAQHSLCHGAGTQQRPNTVHPPGTTGPVATRASDDPGGCRRSAWPRHGRVPRPLESAPDSGGPTAGSAAPHRAACCRSARRRTAPHGSCGVRGRLLHQPASDPRLVNIGRGEMLHEPTSNSESRSWVLPCHPVAGRPGLAAQTKHRHP